MRRLVYLANAIPELFICLLPGSASRECLYIRANTPRVLYARGSRAVQGLPGCVAVGRAHERSVLSFLSYATSVSRSPSRSLSPSRSDLSPPRYFPLLSFRISVFSSLDPFRRGHYAISHERGRKYRRKKWPERSGKSPWGWGISEESPTKWIRYLTSTSSRLMGPRVAPRTSIRRWRRYAPTYFRSCRVEDVLGLQNWAAFYERFENNEAFVQHEMLSLDLFTGSYCLLMNPITHSFFFCYLF